MEYSDAITLLAAIVTQARKDLVPYSVDVCLIPYSHRTSHCASKFLASLDMKINHSARRMSIEELAFAVLEVIDE